MIIYYIHLIYFFFFLLLLFRFIIRTIINSIITIWLTIEISLFLFIYICIYNKYSIERIVNYFLIQSLGSFIFLYRNFLYISVSYKFMLISLLIKLAVAPIHIWLIKVCSGLNLIDIFILLSFQKVIPMIRLFLIIKFNLINYLIYFIYTSSLFGSLGGVGQSSLRLILCYSSISHISWTLRIILISSLYWIKYFFIYSIITIIIIIPINKEKIYRLSQIFSINFRRIVLFFSLGGLPPFIGFFNKVNVIDKLIINNLYLIIIILLFSSLIRLFYYCRLSIFIYINTNFSINKRFNNKLLLFINLNLILVILIFLLYFL